MRPALYRRYKVLIILLLTALLGGCGRGVLYNGSIFAPDNTSIADTHPESQPDNEDGEQPIPAAVINPLTGLPAEDPALLERRPVMVKVSNYPREGRPHAGLSFADIVFDYFIGYGTNRFLTLFYGADAYKIGPVRSGRRVDAQLATMYGGVLGYGSADKDTDAVLVSTLGNYALSHLEADCPAFCGIDTHSATGVFANSAAISEFIRASGWENKKPDLPGMVFDDQPPDNMRPAEKVNILFNYYNRAEWRYDPASKKYLRWIESVENQGETDEIMEMVPLTDRLNGEQLAFSNIVVLLAEYTELAPSAHEIDMRGNKNGLPAYFFRDGGLMQGEWKSVNDSDPLQFFDSEGAPMALKPGNTWIAIMGLSSSFNKISEGEWETFFFLP